MFKEKLESTMKRLLKEFGVKEEEVDFKIEIPPEGYGDLSTNVAFILSRSLKKSPREIAVSISEKLRKESDYSRVEVAGPGFINVDFSIDYLSSVLAKILEEPGFWKKQGEANIQFEFASANPTGPFTVGHGRQAVFGDVLCRVFSSRGFRVQKEMYINDAGRQIGLLGRSLWVRYNQLLGREEELPEDGYQGEYLVEIAQGLANEVGDRFKGSWNDESEVFFKKYALDKMLEDILGTLKRLRVDFENIFYESSLIEDGTVEFVIKSLEGKELIYESEGARWLKVSKLVEDDDKVLVRSNGTNTYFMTDIAYHYNKHERKFKKVFDIWGADHMGHIPRMKAAMKALDIDDDFLNVIIHQYVNLKREGEVVKMSTRRGEFTTLDELVEAVGVDSTRYFFAMFDPDTHMLFDIDLARQRSNDNPVFYVQYANARISNVFRTADEKNVMISTSSLKLLNTKEDRKIIKLLTIFPEILDSIVTDYRTNRLTSYLEDLSRAFHGYYNKNIIVDPENPALSGARLAMCKALQNVLKAGLDLLGVEAPDSM
ncbi:MAG: arginine--tRNA ligase [Mesotoga sp.]|uniref:arginine--tRNA ligase n=1 Tax=Mesotoga sp. TaxID=2053577 RepID=UPI0016A7B528|nr:arginine--tRNA ligase [Mesotoga sp.]MDD2333543.1 arginine--tRNA ligase [Mesotoga sp.]MDD4825381.1 arginine--tRNA ligase [Mesotoga sp.]NLT44334.1 arginine--tRNA ligase [Thermotogaceae bacterium]